CQLAAYRRGRSIECWVVMRLAAVATDAPAICKDVGVEQVGSRHLRPVVERGAEQTIDQFCPGGFAGPDRLESAAIPIAQNRVRRDRDHVLHCGRWLRGGLATFDDRLGQD